MKKFLLNDEIMVFCGDFSLSEKFSPKMLDKSDKARLNDNPNLANSLRFLASRALKFYALNEFLSKNSKAQKPNFCLSHSANCVALAVANFKIGFDIEPLKPRNIEPVMDFCFSEYEKKLISNAPKNSVLSEFYRIFTAKEALLKLFDLNFSDFDKVGFDENGVARLNERKFQCLHHKFSFNGQNFILCCAFSKPLNSSNQISV